MARFRSRGYRSRSRRRSYSSGRRRYARRTYTVSRGGVRL